MSLKETCCFAYSLTQLECIMHVSAVTGIVLPLLNYIIQLCNPFARTITYNTLPLCNLGQKMKRKKMLIFGRKVCFSAGGCNEPVLHCTFLQNGVAGSVAAPEISFGGAVG